MWHEVVSVLNRAAGLVVRQFTEAYAQHPAVMVGFSAALTLLALCLLREMARADAPVKVEERPMLLRR